MKGASGMSKSTWAGIIEKIEAISPAIYATLNPPASKNEIIALEETVGTALPDSFKDYLLTLNGQISDGLPMLGYNRFLSIDEIIDLINAQRDTLGNGVLSEYYTENKVQPVLWDDLWIPFAELDAQMLILDLHAGKNGQDGQVLQLWPGCVLDADDIVCADSFEQFSEEVLRRLRNSEFNGEDDFISFNDDWII